MKKSKNRPNEELENDLSQIELTKREVKLKDLITNLEKDSKENASFQYSVYSKKTQIYNQELATIEKAKNEYINAKNNGYKIVDKRNIPEYTEKAKNEYIDANIKGYKIIDKRNIPKNEDINVNNENKTSVFADKMGLNSTQGQQVDEIINEKIESSKAKRKQTEIEKILTERKSIKDDLRELGLRVNDDSKSEIKPTDKQNIAIDEEEESKTELNEKTNSNVTNLIFCELCKKGITHGISLSNGRQVHKLCISNLEKELEEKSDKLNVFQKELSISKEKPKTIFKKISSLLSKSPQIEDLQTTKVIEKKISYLLSSMDSNKTRLKSIYDYWLDYPPDWEERKKEVYEQNQTQCSKCDSSIKKLHVHHKIPLSRGGNNKISNLTLLCEDCHSMVHGGRDISIDFKSADSKTAFSRRVSNIQYAVENGLKIEFRYKKPEEVLHTIRRVRPKKLLEIEHIHDNNKTLCVLGYCELRCAERNFALKRMKGLKVIENGKQKRSK